MKSFISIIFFYLLFGCQSYTYVNQGVEGNSYIKFCKNGKFIKKSNGVFPYNVHKLIYGTWRKSKDTIVVSYNHPKIYYSCDSTAIVKEKAVSNQDSIYFEIHYPIEQYGIGLMIDKKKFKPNSNSKFRIPILPFKGFLLSSEDYCIKYRKVHENSNYYIIFFRKKVLKYRDSALIDPPIKFIIKKDLLIPLEVYSQEKMDYQYKRISGNKNKAFKKYKFCKIKK